MALLKNSEKIAKEMQETLDYKDLLSCMRCGMCVNSCPTYRVFDRDEAQSPRGRIALMRAVYESTLEPTEEFKKAIDQCVYCKKCMDVCPSKVEYIKMLNQTRKILEKNK